MSYYNDLIKTMTAKKKSRKKWFSCFLCWKADVIFFESSFEIFSYLVGQSNKLSDTYDIRIAHSPRKQIPPNFKILVDLRINLSEVKNFTRSINPLKQYDGLVEWYNKGV